MKTLSVPSKPVAFTSTKVPKFSGVTSWDQYQHVFVWSNGWDDPTVALQLLSHLTVALLVPEVKRACARLWLIWDQFVAGHENCALWRHLDSVPRETPIRDIVDRCRVWESHTDAGARRIVKPVPERALPVYTVDKPVCMPADQVVAAVTAPPVEQGDLEALLRRLLSTTQVPTPPSRTMPTDKEILLKRLLSVMSAPTPILPPQTGITGMETMLQRLLPGTPVPASRSRPARRDWTTIVCFSCGKNRATGWAGARNWMRHSRTCYRDGRQKRWAPISWWFCHESQRNFAGREMATDPGRGVNCPD